MGPWYLCKTLSRSTASEIGCLRGLDGAKEILPRLADPASPIHAVLLYGPEGAGKTQLSLALARAWMCQRPGPDGACGECPPCLSLEAGRPVDFQHIKPQPPSHIIRLGAIIETSARANEDTPGIPILSFFRTGPLMSRAKVVLIERADRMNRDAFNALLKTLEEPAETAKLILTTDALSRMPPTIVSRCLAIACELGDPTGLHPLAEGAPGVQARIEQARETYLAIERLGQRLLTDSPAAAMRIADDLKSLAKQLECQLDLTARNAMAEVLRALAVACRTHPEAVERIAEAHRRVLGNAQAGYVVEALTSGLLLKRSRIG